MKRTHKLSLLVILCLSIFLITPTCTMQVEAATGNGNETIEPQAEIVGWVYDVFGNKLYKRLYNYTTDKFITDWIYVRDLTQEEIDALT